MYSHRKNRTLLFLGLTAAASLLICGWTGSSTAQEPETKQEVHNAPESITGELEGNSLELFSAWRLLSNLAVKMFSGNEAELLSGNAPELLSGNEPEFFSGNAPELLSRNAPEFLSGNEPQLLSENEGQYRSHKVRLDIN